MRAFEAQAVDYLVKPVEESRLADTLDRVRQRLTEKRGAEEVEKYKEALAEVAPEAAEEIADGGGDHSSNRFEKLINIKDRGKIFRVDVDTIEVVEAAGDYMCIKTGDNTLILRQTMKDLEKRLDPRRFQRVHRSTIVNLDLVRQVKPHTNGECFLVLDSGGQVKVSRGVSRRGGAVRSLDGRGRTAMSSNYETFAALHVPGDPLIIYNCWDPGSAVAIAKAGAKAIATGSYGAAGSLGFGDGEEVAARPRVRQCAADHGRGRRARLDRFRERLCGRARGRHGEPRQARRDRRGRVQFRGFGDRRRGHLSARRSGRRASRRRGEGAGEAFYINARIDLYLRTPKDRTATRR